MINIGVLKYALNQVPAFLRIIFGYLVSYFIKVNSWIVLERGYDAQDNGWHFFKYIKQHKNEVPIFYAIKKNSPDYLTNLSEYSSCVLEYDSIWYYAHLFRASVIISTHIDTEMPGWLKGKLSGTFLCPKGKRVFLQHGILHNDIQVLHYPYHNIRLFISGAKREFDLLSRLYGYPEGYIQYTGLARFDNLLDNNPKNKILIMPTWRKSYVSLLDDEFEATPFFKNYSKILSDKDIVAALKASNFQLDFYNHFEFQKFSHLFARYETAFIHILPFGCKNVQDMLKDANMLITDYSSIYYDFIYMQKPVIFFLQDREEFLSQQYGNDFDNPSDFGDVAFSVDELKRIIIEKLANHCSISKRCEDFASEVFPLKDACNCQRIFNAIMQL